MSHKFYCLLCMQGPHEEVDLANHDCPAAFKHGFKVVDGCLEIRRTRWGKFVDWFWSLDHIYIMSFFALAATNGIIMKHVGLTGWSR